MDPRLLVSASLYTPAAIGTGTGKGFNGVRALDAHDSRYPLRPWVLARYSDLDFIDLHVYAGPAPWSLEDTLRSVEITPSTDWGKPVILGEIGVFRHQIPQLASAASAMENLLRGSCAYPITGWAYWTWDSDEQSELWNLRENGGALNGVVAPKGALPSLCQVPAGPFRTSTTVFYSNGSHYCAFTSEASE